MKLEIINDPKKNFGYFDKVKLRLTGDGLNYDASLSLSQISELHFLTGSILTEYHIGSKK